MTNVERGRTVCIFTKEGNRVKRSFPNYPWLLLEIDTLDFAI